MGGNGSYSKALGGVPEMSRTHTDTNYRIDGHKVLLQTKNPLQNKLPMNSNSESPMYLCGNVDRYTGIIKVNQICIYKNHKMTAVIDLKFDKNGNFIAYSSNGKTSHMHLWKETKGDIGRKSHDRENIHHIPNTYRPLIEKIVEFNKSNKRWRE